MNRLLLPLVLILASCAGIGVVETRDPRTKLAQASMLLDQDRALLAEDLINQSLKIFQASGDELGMADAYHAFGNLYKHQSYHTTWAPTFKQMGTYDGTYMKSIENYEKAMQIFEKNGDVSGVVKCMVGIGNAYGGRKESDKGCYYYREALGRYRTAKEGGQIKVEPVIYDNRYKDLGELIEAFIKGYCEPTAITE